MMAKSMRKHFDWWPELQQWIAETQRGPEPDPRGRELTSDEATAALNDMMARLKLKHPHLFKTQADDPDGLSERRWSQR